MLFLRVHILVLVLRLSRLWVPPPYRALATYYIAISLYETVHKRYGFAVKTNYSIKTAEYQLTSASRSWATYSGKPNFSTVLNTSTPIEWNAGLALDGIRQSSPLILEQLLQSPQSLKENAK